MIDIEKLSYSDVVKLYSNYVLKATVETDSSGNNVASEKVHFLENKLSSSTASYISEAQQISFSLTLPINQTIYEQEYIGYNYFERELFLVTNSLNNSVNLGLDTLDIKNVTEE